MGDRGQSENLVLVARKPCFGLPTGCPSCLPVYIYLKFSGMPFEVCFDTSKPDSEDIPSVEYGDYVAFNSEKGGTIEGLKEDGILDMDSKLLSHSIPEWLAMKAMIDSWLADALAYELWIGSGGSAVRQIYYSDLPWIIGKALHWKQTQAAKQRLGITMSNTAEREAEIFRKATKAYEALSAKLGENNFFFEDRPTSLDAAMLGHTLFVLHALSDSSTLRSQLTRHENLVRYSENLKVEFLEDSSTSVPRSPFEPSTSSMPSRKSAPYGTSKPKSKPKKEKTEEEKAFRRRAKYFLLTQLVAVLVFLTLMGGSEEADIEVDDDEGIDYED
ncbi:mitochondrial outer membrane import complex protein METAXIN [Nymphaea colorata]|nr:mitochondrial outer membrane import complex protein METAXIN [Nymphaea colorata]